MTTRAAHAGRTRVATGPHGATIARPPSPRLILLPGLHGTCRLLQPFMAALGEDADVQAFDYPHDRFLDHAELADWVRPQLPAQRPFVLLGESFSGPVALHLAAARPPGLRAVVLSTSFARTPRPALRGLARFARLLPAKAMPLSVFTFWLLGRWTTPALRAAFAEVLAEVDPDVLTERLIACEYVDVSALLPQVRGPLLYLRARNDRLLPPGAADIVRQAVEDTRVVDFAGPHCLLQAIPAQAAKVVREFVAGL